MTFQLVRSAIETKISAAFAATTPATTVIFDNTFETPPALPYAICLLTYTSVTEPTVCKAESGLEALTGSLQISCYVKRGQGMKQLEELGAVAMAAMNTMYEWNSPVRVKCGRINGPVSILSGDQPYALATVSCPFVATVD